MRGVLREALRICIYVLSPEDKHSVIRQTMQFFRHGKVRNPVLASNLAL